MIGVSDLVPAAASSRDESVGRPVGRLRLARDGDGVQRDRPVGGAPDRVGGGVGDRDGARIGEAVGQAGTCQQARQRLVRRHRAGQAGRALAGRELRQIGHLQAGLTPEGGERAGEEPAGMAKPIWRGACARASSRTATSVPRQVEPRSADSSSRPPKRRTRPTPAPCPMSQPLRFPVAGGRPSSRSIEMKRTGDPGFSPGRGFFTRAR